MPVHVTLDLNERTIARLHIARMSGAGRNANAVHTYAVLVQEEPPQSEKEWEQGITFRHRYGDGVEVLLQRALEAVNGVLDPL